jgi:hypothetical protein
VVDFEIPEVMTRGEVAETMVVYVRRSSTSLDGFFAFTTFIHSETGEMYQVANLPSYGLRELKDWSSHMYYIEMDKIVLPDI